MANQFFKNKIEIDDFFITFPLIFLHSSFFVYKVGRVLLSEKRELHSYFISQYAFFNFSNCLSIQTITAPKQ